MTEIAALAAPAPPADALRERLLAAAAEVFAECGYDGARVQEIARRAGLTTGAIYGRFTGKADLLRAAIDTYASSELEELFAERRPDGPLTDILTTVGAHLVTRPTGPGQALLLEAIVAARREPEVAEIVRAHLAARVARLGQLVTEAKAGGSVDQSLDTASIVRFCHAVGLGSLVLDAVQVPRPAAEPWETLVRRMVDAIGPDT